MQTKTGTLLVEDRDTAFLFLDPTGIDEANEGTPVTIEIADGVEDWTDEGPNDNSAVWMSDETGEKLRVVRRDTVWAGDKLLVDFDKDSFIPIPTPVVLADANEWEAHKADMGY